MLRSVLLFIISTAVSIAAFASRPICATGPVSGRSTPILTSFAFTMFANNELNAKIEANKKLVIFIFIDFLYYFN